MTANVTLYMLISESSIWDETMGLEPSFCSFYYTHWSLKSSLYGFDEILLVQPAIARLGKR